MDEELLVLLRDVNLQSNSLFLDFARGGAKNIATERMSGKGILMAIRDVLPSLRRERNLTQDDLARKLFITRQAVSRWETGETTPGIDMTKLIATVLNVPVSELLEMPDHYCESCGMILTGSDQLGTNVDGSKNEHYCQWCFSDGAYTYETSMEDMIEECAPRMAEHMGCTVDECASLLGAVYPTLDRWKQRGPSI